MLLAFIELWPGYVKCGETELPSLQNGGHDCSYSNVQNTASDPLPLSQASLNADISSPRNTGIQTPPASPGGWLWAPTCPAG